MTTNLISAQVTVPNTPTSRTFGDHMSQVVDVRDFGALGNGVADDTAAIQAAVNYAVNNGKLLLFPQANSGQFYNISNQITIPPYKLNWAIRGTSHRVNIKQLTDNKPFLHFDSFGTTGSGLTNGGFDIRNFQVTWTNNQPVANTHAACIEFNDGGYADFVIENISNVNGFRIVTHQYPGQTVGRPLNSWGCIYRHLYNQFSASGAAIYLRSNPVEGLPNILIDHIYSVQNAAGEELIHIAGANSVTIRNVEQNFGNFTPGCTLWGGCVNINIINWRVESWNWNSVGTDSHYFAILGPGLPAITEYSIKHFEMRAANINLTSGPKYLVQTSGSRVVFDGYSEEATTWTAGTVVLFQVNSASDTLEVGLGIILSPNVQFCDNSTAFLGNITFTGGTRTLEFYKNAVTASMTPALNDDASTIVAKTVATMGWIWSMEVKLNAAVTAGTFTAILYKNNAVLDSSNFAVAITSGTTGTHYNVWLKNTNVSAYQVLPGDQLDVRITTTGTLAGPTAAKIIVNITNG
jgi:hypothetical protein